MIDLGQVVKGEKRSYTIPFSNTGTENIEIDLISSCECTTVTWPEGEIIRPGGRNEISFVFDSTEKEESETVDIDGPRHQNNQIGYTVKFFANGRTHLTEPHGVNDPQTMPFTFAGAIIHELTHNVLDTKDVDVAADVYQAATGNNRPVGEIKCYGTKACHALARLHPDDAVENADSYRLFCEDAFYFKNVS